MRVSDQQILKAVRVGLKRLGAELPAGSSSHLLSAIDLAVAELAARAGGRADSVRASYIEAIRLVQRGGSLAAKAGVDVVSSRIEALPELATNDLAALDARYADLRQRLVECTRALGRAQTQSADEAWQADVASFFHDLARFEADRAAQDVVVPEVESGAEDALPTEQQLAAYFAAHRGCTTLPGPLQLQGLKLLSGGFSRQTMLANVRDADGRDRAIVIRKQVPGGFLDGACNELVEEVPFLQLAPAAGLPVPQLYWHETDSTILGGEFFVTECMPGATVGSSYQMAEGVGEELFKQLAQIMAALHCIDWTSHADALRAGSRIPSGAEADSASAALAMVGQFEGYWRRANLEPLPTMELLVDWLKRNVPSVTRRAVLCHGDIGFHNLLVQDGRVTAVLDWETSRLADPARDLSYMRPMVIQYVDWESFMGWYRDAGGLDVDDASLDYYAVFAAFAHVLVCDVAMGDSFPRAAKPNLEYLRLGLPVKAYFFNELMQTSAAVWGKIVSRS